LSIAPLRVSPESPKTSTKQAVADVSETTSVWGLLEEACRAWPARPLLSVAGYTRSLSFDECRALALQVAATLSARGVAAGDRIVVVAENRWEIPVLVFAAARCGATFVILSEHITPGSLHEILELVSAKLLIVGETQASLVPATRREGVLVLAAVAEPGQLGVLGDADVSTLPAPPTSEAPATLIFTSGSTGSPKGVVVSHANVSFTSRAIQERLRYRVGDVVGLFLPLCFDYGLYQLFLACRAGATLCVGSAAMAGPAFLNTLREQRVSVLPGVPSLFVGLTQLLQRRPATDLALRMLTNTGEHLADALVESLQRLLPGIDVYSMYGLTECKRVAILLPEERALKPGSVGRPLAGTRAYVLDATGCAQTSGEGELVLVGPHVTSGYFGDQLETRKFFFPDPDTGELHLHSGDTCRIDEDGFIYFIGRIGAQLKHKGHRIHPKPTEQRALEFPGVREAALVKQRPEGPLRLFVSIAPTQPDFRPAGLLVHLRGCLEPYRVPDEICVVDSLPKTNTGKIDRLVLSARGSDGFA
jgi:acyl-coenzyme A synthetase/AMP-(fatty) acid ligase